jgi:hypothetical protein
MKRTNIELIILPLVDAKFVELETFLLELIIFWIEHAIVDNIEYF